MKKIYSQWNQYKVYEFLCEEIYLTLCLRKNILDPKYIFSYTLGLVYEKIYLWRNNKNVVKLSSFKDVMFYLPTSPSKRKWTCLTGRKRWGRVDVNKNTENMRTTLTIAFLLFAWHHGILLFFPTLTWVIFVLWYPHNRKIDLDLPKLLNLDFWLALTQEELFL